MNGLNLIELQKQITEGHLSIVDIVQFYLEKIETSKSLNIYIEVFEEEVLAKARQLDEKIQNGDSLGQLFGTVISIKDVICYKDHKLTASSKILEGFTSQFTATALQKLIDEDVLVIGRTNCDEFAMGSSNENSIYGITPNGVDPTRVAGGSSGAAAVSVQQDTCLVALGTDTGGSVRQPASFNGVIGMKPSYGRISRYGVIAYGSSFDQIGVIGKHLNDVAIFIHTMSGHDNMDGTSVTNDVVKKSELLGPLSFAFIDAVFNHEKLNSAIQTSSKELLNQLTSAGHSVNEVQFPLLEYLVPSYYVLTTAEASSNLGRYDGLRYGYRSNDIERFDHAYQRTRTEGFGSEVKRRIMLGTFVLSSGYYDAYYTKAQKVRRLVTKAIEAIFEKNQFLLLPSSTNVAWKIGEMDNDPVEMYLSDIFTVLANLAGIPAISIPLSSDAEGNPYGIQIMCSKFRENDLVHAAGTIFDVIND